MVPTHVGVYRMKRLLDIKFKNGPHACGGVPNYYHIYFYIILWSPRMWGCTGRSIDVMHIEEMVPTHVGVYR